MTDNTPAPSSDTSPPAAQPQTHAQPADSDITLLQTDRATAAVIPPVGFAGPGAMIVFLGVLIIFCGCFYLTFLLIALSGAGVRHIDPDRLGGTSMVWSCGGIIVLGLGIVLAGIHSAKCSTVLTITPQDLIYTRKSPLRKAEQSWPLTQIIDIRSVYGGSEIGGTGYGSQRSVVLQILIQDQDALELFEGRRASELQWLAQQLRNAGGLPKADGPKTTSA